ESPSLITVDDSLRSTPSEHFDMVLTNPPFGRKSSYKVVNALGETEREDMSYLREDFWATTSNKQLNFLQHVRSLLKINGRAAIDDFVASYSPENRHERAETERFKAFSYDELVARDNASLDIFWLRDESLEDTGNLPAPELIAAEIVEDLQAALDQFAAIAA